jgi:hypothetical protein
VESVKQILTTFSLPNQRGKVAVRLGNHPHIDLDRVGASQPFKFLLLHRAQ